MNRVRNVLILLALCGPRVCARSAPPTLVGLPGTPVPPADGLDFGTTLLWITIALGGVAALLIVGRWLATKQTKSVRSSAVLVTMCRGLRLTAADQRTLKQLARNEESITPVTLILCPSVFERAAARAGSRVNKDSVHRLRQRLAG